MSLSGSITFQTSNVDSLVFKRILKALLDYGWSSDEKAPITFNVISALLSAPPAGLEPATL
jgi:hypothetical protein